MNTDELLNQATARWPDIGSSLDTEHGTTEFHADTARAAEFCDWLFNELGCHFAGVVAEEGATQLDLWYLFISEGAGRIQVRVSAPLDMRSYQSIAGKVHAADWHERGVEDLFGITFEGHPKLGDFILHDDTWGEGVAPMRKSFDARTAITDREPRIDWTPSRVVHAPGSFVMPVGPIFSGDAEAAHFQLETIGEEVIRALPRLFFKYRGVEKIAEGRSIDDALLLAERFAGTAAFSHGLAFCEAVERISGVQPPDRARYLRVFLAELERFRSHVGAIEGICNSTGLAVADNQAAILEEQVLRLTAEITDHRYLFGMAVPGGLSRDITDAACNSAAGRLRVMLGRLDELEQMLRFSNSFLDRIESVGAISTEQARDHGLVGPVARASGYCYDLRRLQPYLAYDQFEFHVPCDQEGDSYARLRVLFAEARQSFHIIEQAVSVLPSGETLVPCGIRAGVACGAVEAPRGATYHWLRIDKSGRISRYRPITPSFSNWHGLHLAVEGFAFQDFPIILATFGLSVAENDL